MLSECFSQHAFCLTLKTLLLLFPHLTCSHTQTVQPAEQTLVTLTGSGWDPWPRWHLVTVMVCFHHCWSHGGNWPTLPGSSARVLPLAKAISPVLISPVLVAMPTSALTGELVSLCFSLLCKCAPLRADAQACYVYMKASIPSAASHHLYL